MSPPLHQRAQTPDEPPSHAEFASPALAPGRRPPSLQYGATRDRRPSQRRHTCEPGDPVAWPAPTSADRVRGSDDDTERAFGQAFARPGSEPTAASDLRARPVDFGEVAIGGGVATRSILVELAPELDSLSIDSIAATDALGAATFSTLELDRGTVWSQGRKAELCLRARPLSAGAIERELVVTGTARPKNRPPRPIDARIRVLVDAFDPALRRALHTIQSSIDAVESTLVPPPILGTPFDGKAAPDTGVRVDGYAMDAGEALSAFDQLAQMTLSAQRTGVARLRDDLAIEDRKEIPTSFMAVAIELSLSCALGGIAGHFGGRLAVAIKDKVLAATVADAFKAGLKTAFGQSLQSLRKSDSPTVRAQEYLDRYEEILLGAQVGEVLAHCARRTELTRHPAIGAIAGHMVGAAQESVMKATDLQYYAALAQWLKQPIGPDSRMPQNIGVDVGPDSVRCRSCPDANQAVAKRFQGPEGAAPFSSLEPNLQIHSRDRFGAPYHFEKRWNEGALRYDHLSPAMPALVALGGGVNDRELAAEIGGMKLVDRVLCTSLKEVFGGLL